MNKNLFRLVFNAARGQVMAVSEVACSHSGGQGTGVETKNPFVSASNRPLSPVDIAPAAIKSIVSAIALLLAPAWFAPAAWAQAAPATTVVVNAAAPAPQQPTVTTTASGVTQVNIQTAVGGVSRNSYTQFDVGNPGLILNNSPVNSNTQIGGWVAGNTNLASGSANIILNEVNSTNPTQLRGYIEVAGQKAEVVIANPAGISVNGGGFINASGATLTTGTPQFSGNSLTGYQVNGGTITVTGTGLDTANTAITTLQAQKIILQGGVFAQDLRVTGDNSAGTANAVAIDVAAIGGMYANKITILATGQGAGVNNAGTLQANSGSFTLSADGTLTNTGTINSTATTRINAETVNNSTGGAIYGGSVAIAATTLNNAATSSTDTAPAIAARDSAGRVDIGVTTLNNQEGALIYSAGAMTIGGALDANGQATGRATTVTNNSATLEAAGDIAITTQTLANTYTSLSAEAVVDTSRTNSGSESCGSECTDSWVDTFYKAVAIEGPNGAAVIRAGGNLTLDASTSALNSSSQIMAAGTVTNTGTANLTNQGIDLTDTVRTARNHHVEQGYMQNGIDCNPLGFNCRSEHRIRHTYSTNYIADNQTVKPGLATEHSTAPSTTTTPNSALFATSSNASYLVETNPAFTNKQIWLSSDFMLQALTVDPDITQKRMGDGFYEQRLINEQIARLTGYARLANYSSDEQQYQALMNAGITLAQPLKLRVGIALTAEQVAQLTSDIVWLVQQEVTLTDGSKQKVLVPQVYAVARSGDLAANGALLSGNIVNLNTTGDITNSNASIQGRELVTLNATNVRNLAGRVEGKEVSLNATQDIENIGGAVIAQQSLSATAGRDLKVQTTTLQSQQAASTGNLKTGSTDVSRVAGLYVTGDAGVLLASAGRDIELTAALLQSKGSTTVSAARDLTLNTVTTSASMDATMNGDNYNRTSRSTETGTTLQSSGNTTLTAGQDIRARAADVQAASDLNVSAGNNVVIESGVATSSVASSRKTNNSGFLSSSTRTDRSSSSSTQAIASNFGGNNVTVTSGQDIGIKASNVVADKDVTLAAGGNVTIEAGTNTQTQSSYSAMSESGLMTSGGLDISIGTRDQSTDQKNTRATAAASTLGTTGGNVSITAGQTYAQTGSDVLATGTAAGTGNIDITAKKIDIVEARETSANETKTESKQSGITLALSNHAFSAAQALQKMAAAAENTKSDRMKALAAASGVLAVNSAAPAAGKLLNGQATSADFSISLSIGASSSESKSTNTSNTARGSSVIAGGNTTLRATGDGTNSDLTIQGSTVQSGDTTTLVADNQVLLLATANTATQTSDQKSSSGSVGVSLGKNTGVTLSASQGSGDGNGQDLYYTNTQIQGGKVVNIQSGGDTTLKGAVVKADTVNAAVGGNLNIESLQDSSRYKESSQNAGGSLTIGPAPGGSISLGASKINSDYQSVTEQSGIRAGDGGFNVNVQGDTDLKGGAITSTQKAIDDNKNSFQTAKLTTSDIQNSANYSAESYQVSVGTSGGSAGAGQNSGSAASTTKAAISGIAGNTAARTGDAETGIQKVFDQTAVSKEINAQVAITQEFGKQAPKAVADYAQAKAEALKKTDPEEAKKWAEGGVYRVALHATLGALTGGTSGAAGAATIAYAAPLMDQLQEQIAATLEKSGLSKEAAAATAKTITQTTALAVGTAVGGVQGGAMALNVDANNRQLHLVDRQLAASLAAKGKYTQAQIEEQMRLMGNDIFNEKANTVTTLIGSDAIVNSVDRDPSMPKTITGNIAVEIAGQANLEIQQYIIANSKEGAGYIPGATPYVMSNPALNKPVLTYEVPTGMPTAKCGNMDADCKAGVGGQQTVPMTPAQRQAAGEYFGNVTTQYQRAAALATATGNAPVVLSFEIAAGVTALLEQAFKPSAGKVLVDSSIDMAAVAYSKASGIPISVINEVVERIIKPAADPLRTKIDQAATKPK
jgi:filamentous hemagglutinin